MSRVLGKCYVCTLPVGGRGAATRVQDVTVGVRRLVHRGECEATAKARFGGEPIAGRKVGGMPTGTRKSPASKGAAKAGGKEWSPVKRPEDDWGQAIAVGEDNPFEGVFKGTRTIVMPDEREEGKTRDASIHDFEVDGEAMSVWGSYDLDLRLAEVKPGSEVRIEFVERVPIGNGQDVKRYNVYTR